MTMLVRSALAAALATTMLLLGLAGVAGAQTNYAPVPPLQGPGTINNTTGILSGEPGSALTDNALAFEVPVIAAPAGTGGGDSDLAFTGADSNVLAAAGMSLVLVGGAAVVVSRKRS